MIIYLYLYRDNKGWLLMMFIDKVYNEELKRIMSNNINSLDAISKQISNGYVSIFAGAGLSVKSGYVDWRSLLAPLCEQLGLDINTDLTEVAQFYENKYGRQGLNDVIYEEFDKVPKKNDNVELLSKLPIKEYWTTNYDEVIEKQLGKVGKKVNLVADADSFKYHGAKNEVVVYKMHGDKKHPDTAVISKRDYNDYDQKRRIFTEALSVGLVSRTFVFIGFSFNDPNLDRILSIAHSLVDSKNISRHYCFMRKIQIEDYLDKNGKVSDELFKRYIHDMNYQNLKIENMHDIGIETILVDSFDQITTMLQYLYNKYIMNNVFIAGGVNPDNKADYGEFNNNNQKGKVSDKRLNKAENFLTLLGKRLRDNGFEIYTGFGAGVGEYILSGVLSSSKNEELDIENVSDNGIHIRSLINQQNKEQIREKMISQCSSTIFVFGYRSKDNKNSGISKEYEISNKYNNFIVPVGATGFESKTIYDELRTSQKYLERLGDSKCDEEVLVANIIKILLKNKKNKEEELKNKLLSSIKFELNEINVFLSYHYQKDNGIAKKITQIVNNDINNCFNVIEEERHSEKKQIEQWVDSKIANTKITVLLISERTLQRKFVKYEIKKSRQNNNIILPIIVDRKKSNNKKLIKNIVQLGVSSKDIKFWYKDDGEHNIIEWLNKLINKVEN